MLTLAFKIRYPQPVSDICALKPKLSNVYSVVNPISAGWCIQGVEVLRVGTTGTPEPNWVLDLSSEAVIYHERQKKCVCTIPVLFNSLQAFARMKKVKKRYTIVEER